MESGRTAHPVWEHDKIRAVRKVRRGAKIWLCPGVHLYNYALKKERKNPQETSLPKQLPPYTTIRLIRNSIFSSLSSSFDPFQFGLTSSLCSWIQSFVSDKPQVLRTAHSLPGARTLDAPQGWVLSLLLYSFYTSNFTFTKVHLSSDSSETAMINRQGVRTTTRPECSQDEKTR